MGKKIVKRIASFTVQEAVDGYLATAHVKQLAAKTQLEYRKELDVFGAWCAMHTLIQDTKHGQQSVMPLTHDLEKPPITLDLVTDYVVHCFLDHLRTTHKPNKTGQTELSTYTLAGYVRVIKSFLNWCLLDAQYSAGVNTVLIQRIEKPKVIETIIDVFSKEQVEALFDACAKEESEHLQIRDRAIIALLLDTGIRAHELVTLTIGNVSLDAKDAYVRVLGKGPKWGEVGLGEQARRAVQKYIRQFREPTIEHEVDQDKERFSSRQLIQIKKQTVQHALVFVNRYGERLTVSGLDQLFERLGRWAQIEGVRCSPHTFRHTFAVLFWRRTKDIRTLSKLLRHSSIAVTENYLKSIQQAEARIGAPSVLDEL